MLKQSNKVALGVLLVAGIGIHMIAGWFYPVYGQNEPLPSPSPVVEEDFIFPSPEPTPTPETDNQSQSLQEWWLSLFLGEKGQDAQSIPEIVSEEIAPDDLIGEEQIPNEEVGEPSIITPIPTPPLSVWRLGREVVPDAKARHSCEVEVVKVDLTEKTFAFRKLLLTTQPNTVYRLEVGDLPDGIDVVFSATQDHVYRFTSPLESVDLEISRQTEARKGDFATPIVFTGEGFNDSAVICQLNLVNF